MNKAYLKHFYGFTLEEIERLSEDDKLGFLLAIDIINSRNDIRAMSVNNLARLNEKGVDRVSRDLRKRAYPHSEKEVHSFDDIEKLFKG